MSAKFTPGPWTLIWHGREVYPYPLSIHTEDDSMWIARDGTISTLANARLIAAAPEMLEALASIRQFSSAIERGEEPWREGVQEITRMALAAIAKAEGRSDA